MVVYANYIKLYKIELEQLKKKIADKIDVNE